MVVNTCLFTRVGRVLSAEASTLQFHPSQDLHLQSQRTGTVVRCKKIGNIMLRGELVGWKFQPEGFAGWIVEIYND